MPTPDLATLETQPELSLLENPETFASHLQVEPGIPEWLELLKKENHNRFLALPMPTRKDQTWRFTNTKGLNLDGYHHQAQPIDGNALLKKSNLPGNSTTYAVFGDEILAGEIQLPEDLKAKGVIFTSIKDAISNHSELLQKYYLNQEPGLGSEKFHALHAALNSNGVFLYVPDNVEVEQTFAIHHYACTDQLAIFPHTIIATGRNSRISVEETFASNSEETTNYVCASANIQAGSGSKVNYSALQNWNTNTKSLHLNTVDTDADASTRTVNLNLGSQYMRHEHHTSLSGTGSSTETYSLSIPTGTQLFDQRTLQTHNAEHTYSNLLCKNALNDEARTVFSGLIKVAEKASDTDAYQSNRNLLLSESSEANSLPGLEILTSDVKCSHGATTGKLDEEEIFYFMARGVPEKKARELLVFGFFEEILGKLDNEDFAEIARQLIRKKFA